MNQKQLDRIKLKTRLGKISLRQCRKAYQIVFKKPMPDRLAYVEALFLGAEKVGDDKVARIIRAIDRIDGPIELIAGWEN